MKKVVTLSLSVCIACVFQAKAQFNFEQLIQSGPSDVEKLVDAYTKPLLHGFGLGMNSGWSNTAKSLGLLHFDLRVTGTGSFVPSSQRYFDVTKIGLSNNIRPANPNQVITPSFSGNPNRNGPLMDVFDGNNNRLISFELPSGVLEEFVPTPQIQLTAGFLANTDLTVRAAPKIRLGERFGSVSLIGFGIKHNLVRDFVSKDLKQTPFDLALLVGFSRLNYSKSLDLKPLNGMVPENAAQATDFSNQEIYTQFDNYLFQAILSKQLSFFTPFAGVGYSISHANLGLKGNYPIVNSIRNDQLAYITYTDPFKIEQTYLKTMRFDVGFEVRLLMFRLYASYGMSGGFGMINGGVGLGF